MTGAPVSITATCLPSGRRRPGEMGTVIPFMRMAVSSKVQPAVRRLARPLGLSAVREKGTTFVYEILIEAYFSMAPKVKVPVFWSGSPYRGELRDITGRLKMLCIMKASIMGRRLWWRHCIEDLRSPIPSTPANVPLRK